MPSMDSTLNIRRFCPVCMVSCRKRRTQRLAAAETEIEKYLSLGNYYVAYFRILNTLGIENLHEATVAELKKHLENERVRAAEELARAKAEYEAEQRRSARRSGSWELRQSRRSNPPPGTKEVGIEQ